MIDKKINKLRNLIKLNNIDGYIVPKNDEFFSEYAFPNRLKTISNFSGSAGVAIILKEKNFLFVDGRYTLQSKIESGNNFKIIEIPKLLPHDLLRKYKKELFLGFDPKLFTNNSLKRSFKDSCNLFPINQNLIDLIDTKKIYDHRKESFYTLDDKVVGESVNSKINKLILNLKKNKIDNIFISAPENVAWLLNLRGKDNPYSPIPNCQIILTKNKKIYFFSSKNKIVKIKNQYPYKNFNFSDFNEFFSLISKLPGKYFSIDSSTCSVFNESIIKSKFICKSSVDPCYEMKAIKNQIEIKNMVKAHIYDGTALTKFIYWIKNNKKFNFTEIDAEKKLEKFRKQNINYLYPSFNTIAGSGPNSAIIHYRANKLSQRKIKKNDIFLCDSGGQYKYGTTDVTRTLCFNKPPKRIKDIFTRVLKGHIAVANTNLNKKKTGKIIDKSARYYLNKINLDYAHGTGHGVGFFLNVHEGPQAISKYNEVPLKPGMILSNEPGYYRENEFGIRIENLVYIKKYKNKNLFKNLTLAPIDTDLVNFKLLNKEEKNYLSKYHLEVYSKISKFLDSKEKKWLLNLI
jgi:Xaa-Pro aminopeptidase